MQQLVVRGSGVNQSQDPPEVRLGFVGQNLFLRLDNKLGMVVEMISTKSPRHLFDVVPVGDQ
jgi:hypothetical protein